MNLRKMIRPKPALPIEKSMAVLMTNQEWLVSDMFCDPRKVARQIRMMEQNAGN